MVDSVVLSCVVYYLTTLPLVLTFETQYTRVLILTTDFKQMSVFNNHH